MDGVIVVDKPREWTSHDVVNKMRRFAGTRKVGHLGTLDPGATGVLPLVIGRATRLAQFYTRNDKIYEGVIHFGYSTDTYDGDGTPVSDEIPVTLDRAQLESLLDRFRGEITQTPPAVSAKKIAGVPAYALARKHQPVELEPVQVNVYSLDLGSMENNEAAVRVHCSAGTYLRSIAHDAGQLLGCGAFLKSLRRIASGDFKIESARTLEQLAELATIRQHRRSADPGRAALTRISAGSGRFDHRQPDPQRPRLPHLAVLNAPTGRALRKSRQPARRAGRHRRSAPAPPVSPRSGAVSPTETPDVLRSLTVAVPLAPRPEPRA